MMDISDQSANDVNREGRAHAQYEGLNFEVTATDRLHSIVEILAAPQYCGDISLIAKE